MNEELLIPESQSFAYPPVPSRRQDVVRQTLEVAFRHRRMVLGFLALATLAAIAAAIWLPSYQSTMKILVKHERVDPVVTPDNVMQTAVTEVTEQDINSEVELLTSNDLIAKVAIMSGMVNVPAQAAGTSAPPTLTADQQEDLAQAVRKIQKRLVVEPVKRSNVISVAFRSHDPKFAETVVKNLATAYMQKHLEVHHSPAGSEFFQQEVKDSQQKLADAQAKLAAFGQSEGVAPDQAKQIVVQKLNEFQVEQQQTAAAISETQHRVDNLQGQLTSTPMRRVTSERRSDNPQLEEKLKGDLLDLELKRTALLQKFKPTYRPVVEVDTQIAQTKAAIASMQKAPLQEQVTDADPTHDWIRNELAKAQAELSSLKARSVATAKSIQLYGDMAKNLDSKSLTQGDLEREVKAQEQNYLLYVKKQEEARITDALDKQRVVNVSLAEEPTNPILPVHSVLFYGLAVGLFFITLGAGTVYLKDRLDPSVRTATELEECLDLPILADVPRHRAALPAA